MSIKTLHLNIQKLCTHETVRYQGPAPGQTHGVYTISLATRCDSTPEKLVELHMSLEAMMQLKMRIDAALGHMITH